MSTTSTTPNTRTGVHGTLVRIAAYAGVAAPILFVIGFLAQEAVRRDEFDWVSEPVSALAIGPDGWAQTVNFWMIGLLTIVFAAGLHRGMAPTRAGFAGPLIMLVSGTGCCLAAVFPLEADAAGETVFPIPHVVASTIFFMSSSVALIVLSRRAAHDPRWRSLAPWALASGLAGVACFVVMGTLVIPDDAPLHDWAGLAQRIVVVVVLFPPRIALAAQLLRVGDTGFEPVTSSV